jgi:hypothetical protein
MRAEFFTVTNEHGVRVRSAHPSKTAKGGAASSCDDVRYLKIEGAPAPSNPNPVSFPEILRGL